MLVAVVTSAATVTTHASNIRCGENGAEVTSPGRTPGHARGSARSSPLTKTPHIPVPALRRPTSVSLSDTPPPTIRFGAPPPPPPGPFGSSGPGSSRFDGDTATGPSMPEVGEVFQGFRLVEELGRGTFGRVFLAH